MTTAPIRRPPYDENAPVIYHTHGGGRILGDPFVGVDQLCDRVLEFGAVAPSHRPSRDDRRSGRRRP